jgi:PAS domain-containing protein
LRNAGQFGQSTHRHRIGAAEQSAPATHTRPPHGHHLQDQLLNCIDLLLDAVFLVDADGRIKYVNAACERIFGYTPDELIGAS